MSISSAIGLSIAYPEFDLKNKLLAIQGVAQVLVIGGELLEYQVLVEQERLRLEGLPAGHSIFLVPNWNSHLVAFTVSERTVEAWRKGRVPRSGPLRANSVWERTKIMS